MRDDITPHPDRGVEGQRLMGLEDWGTRDLGLLRITGGSSQPESSCCQMGGVCPVRLRSENDAAALSGVRAQGGYAQRQGRGQQGFRTILNIIQKSDRVNWLNAT